MKIYFDIMVPRDHEWIPKPLYLVYLSKVRQTILNRGVDVYDVKENALYDSKTGKPVYPVYMFECYGEQEKINDLYPHVQANPSMGFRLVHYA